MGTKSRILAFTILFLACINTGIPKSKTAQAASSEIHYFDDPETLSTYCTEGNARACTVLGARYQQGRSLPKNLSSATEYYEKACNLGSPKSCFDFAELQFKHNNQRVEATAIFEKLCNQTDMMMACQYASSIYERGVDDIPANAEKSKAYWAHGKEVRYLPISLSMDETIDQKISRTINNCEQDKLLAACDTLGSIYKEGVKHIKADPEKSEAYFMKACRQNSFPSCFKIDEDKAGGLKRVEKLCVNENNVAACILVASKYKNGAAGVPVSRAKANEYYDKACLLGHDKSCLEAFKK
ncbi:MAG: hypothetical protein CMN56_05135 [Sneathiella sp.]|uniref:tetratricopeptide repeat protein n=1 Tax=Sneathiella sp. TaxID=1964365 RepID=UPI000C65C5DC|nr:tetratricopeptide repeat protein [Sneathiella sp.]MAZ02504.1 hypothetical protein [Sneathiella sp.]